MIPHVLEIKNFLSYGNTPERIDFKNYGLICLSGRNGNGKSALLDAMSWALWGCARKVGGLAKADEGLLRLGQTQMMVSLQFECNERTYRVRREFIKTYGRNQATLDFEVFDKEKAGFISLTDKTIKDTQEKIIAAIGLDFETFINTAFVRQGHSNEFSQKNPKERKTILATILGLSRYEVLKNSAHEKAKQFAAARSLLAMQSDQAAQELKEREVIEKNRSECKQKLQVFSSQILEYEQQLRLLTSKLESYARSEEQCMMLEASLSKLTQEEKDMHALLKSMVEKWRAVHKHALTHTTTRDTLEASLKDLREKNKHFRTLHEKSLHIHEHYLKAKEAYLESEQALQVHYDQQGKTIHAELEAATAQYKQLSFLIEHNKGESSAQSKKIELIKKEMQEVLVQLQHYESVTKEHEKLRVIFEKRRAFYQAWVQRGNFIAAKISELEHKKKVLLDCENPTCPTCEQVLTIRRKQFLLSGFGEEYDQLLFQKQRMVRLLSGLKELLVANHEQIKNFEKQNEHSKLLELKRKQLSESQTELESSSALVKTQIEQQMQVQNTILKPNIDALQQRLKLFEEEKIKKITIDPALVKQREQLKKLEEERSLVKYDKKVHDQVNTELLEAEKLFGELEQMSDEYKKQDLRRAQIAGFITNLKKIKHDYKNFDAQKKAREDELREKTSISEQHRTISTHITAAKEGKETLMQQLGRLDSELSRLSRLSEEILLREKKMAELDGQMQEYATLASLFSKDGLQAVLIEEALPEIEHETNALLAKLTDNNSQIMIDSLRDLKKGGVKETLDIKISDSAGIRPYELFSGGEAFRIDFALRIAISKLLARRAGTALKTLIIDEGFGSQDDEGLQRLMDAMYLIQDDFSRVIIVSHLPVFKDNFPIHFVVEKTSSGSRVTVVERG